MHHQAPLGRRRVNEGLGQRLSPRLDLLALNAQPGQDRRLRVLALGQPHTRSEVVGRRLERCEIGRREGQSIALATERGVARSIAMSKLMRSDRGSS